MSSNIKVMVRPRPLDEGKKEKWAAGLEFPGGNRRIMYGGKSYDPDVSMQPTASQDDTFAHCMPIVESVKDGYNGTIMVYGQTGTGKTHTMIGEDGNGIALKAIDQLQQHVRRGGEMGRKLALTLTVLEIYNEKITDMLSPVKADVTLINGLPHSAVSKVIASSAEAQRIVATALNSRHVSSTAMNDRSSRSHVMIMAHLEEVTSSATGGETTDISRLFLVDLAGSESVKKSQVTGKEAKEAGMINKSLCALKSVIERLATAGDGPNKPHVPYRDSRLTEMLQDSIGGTARTMLIACISPNGKDIDETKSTLEYATKARAIRNVSNTDRDKMKLKIHALEAELLKAQNKLTNKVNERNGTFVSKEEIAAAEDTKEKLGEAEHSVMLLQTEIQKARTIDNYHTSELAIKDEQLKEMEAAVQDGKIKMLAQVEKSIVKVKALEAVVVRHYNDFETIVDEDHAAHAELRRELMSKIETESMGGAVDAMGALWDSVNQKHAEAIAGLVTSNDVFAAEADAAAVQHEQAQQALIAELQSSVQRFTDGTGAVMKKRRLETAASDALRRSVNDGAIAMQEDLSKRGEAEGLLQSVVNNASALAAGLPALEKSERLQASITHGKHIVKNTVTSTSVASEIADIGPMAAVAAAPLATTPELKVLDSKVLTVRGPNTMTPPAGGAKAIPAAAKRGRSIPVTGRGTAQASK
jgi:hypothetical protein